MEQQQLPGLVPEIRSEHMSDIWVAKRGENVAGVYGSKEKAECDIRSSYGILNVTKTSDDGYRYDLCDACYPSIFLDRVKVGEDGQLDSKCHKKYMIVRAWYSSEKKGVLLEHRREPGHYVLEDDAIKAMEHKVARDMDRATIDKGWCCYKSEVCTGRNITIMKMSETLSEFVPWLEYEVFEV